MEMEMEMESGEESSLIVDDSLLGIHKSANIKRSYETLRTHRLG
jgi:hypothetical protein